MCIIKKNKNKEETICEKVKIDGFEYYISDEIAKPREYYYSYLTNKISVSFIQKNKDLKKVLCTNNPNIDIPKIINEFENLAEQDADKCEYYKHPNSDNGYYDHVEGFKAGYNKAKETYQFTEQDMIEFSNFVRRHYMLKLLPKKSYQELLSIWKEQQTKIIFYE